MTNKTDQEILTLAAQADGHDVYFDELSGLTFYGDDKYSGLLWNPLHHDGDAMRLAVKLGMEVYIDNHPEGCACTEVSSPTYSYAGTTIINHDDDAYAATRRAIVLFAARTVEKPNE
jgi:hypothetical protein